jgi:ribonuclease VapC
VIVVDTSALMAILLEEPEGNACIDAMEAASELAISAATAIEALVVADRRNLRAQMQTMLDSLGFEIVDVDAASVRRIADVYASWGKGAHRAALNFVDCFAYDLAKRRGWDLLYVGRDFAATDIRSAR